MVIVRQYFLGIKRIPYGFVLILEGSNPEVSLGHVVPLYNETNDACQARAEQKAQEYTTRLRSTRLPSEATT